MSAAHKGRAELLDAVVDSFVEADAKESRRREILNSLLETSPSNAANNSSNGTDSGDSLFSKSTVDDDDDFLFSGSAPIQAQVVYPSGVTAAKPLARETVSAAATASELVSIASPSSANNHTDASSATDGAEGSAKNNGDDGAKPESIATASASFDPDAANGAHANSSSSSVSASASAATPRQHIVSAAALSGVLPSAAAAAAVGEKPQPRPMRNHSNPTGTTSTEAKPAAAKTSFFDSLFDKVADFFDPLPPLASAPNTKAAAVAVARRKPRGAKGRALGRVRTDELVEEMFTVFAELDKDKDGKVSKDEAWKHLLKCGHARVEPLPPQSTSSVTNNNNSTSDNDSNEGNADAATSTATAAAGAASVSTPLAAAAAASVRVLKIDQDQWDRIKDCYEDALSQITESLLLTHEEWSDVFSDIDVDNETLAMMLESGRVNANKK